MSDRTKLDVRDNDLYKLILKQSNQRESLLNSCKRVLKDLDEFNFSKERHKEIIDLQIASIEKLSNKHWDEINSFDLRTIW